MLSYLFCFRKPIIRIRSQSTTLRYCKAASLYPKMKSRTMGNPFISRDNRSAGFKDGSLHSPEGRPKKEDLFLLLR